MAKKSETTGKVLTEAEKVQAKKDAFARVVRPRVSKAVKAIELVGSCATKAYTYNIGQTDAIIAALQAAVNNVKDRYAGKAGSDGGFKLPN